MIVSDCIHRIQYEIRVLQSEIVRSNMNDQFWSKSVSLIAGKIFETGPW